MQRAASNGMTKQSPKTVNHPDNLFVRQKGSLWQMSS